MKNMAQIMQKKNKQYKEEWLQTGNKKDFVALLLKKYGFKKQTANRRYYDVKHIPLNKNKYQEEQKQPIDEWKTITFNDMIRLKVKITRNRLIKHGFTNQEINGLIDKGKVILEDE